MGVLFRIDPAVGIQNDASVCLGAGGPLTHLRGAAAPSGETMLFALLDGRFRTESSLVPPLASANDVSVAAASGDANVYYAARPGVRQVVREVFASYATTPTSGELLVQSPSGTNVFRQYVPGAGPTPFEWKNGLAGAPGADMLVILKAGNAAKELSVRPESR